MPNQPLTTVNLLRFRVCFGGCPVWRRLYDWEPQLAIQESLGPSAGPKSKKSLKKKSVGSGQSLEKVSNGHGHFRDFFFQTFRTFSSHLPDLWARHFSDFFLDFGHRLL